MPAKIGRFIGSLRPIFRLALLVFSLLGIFVSVLVVVSADTAQASASLLDRARLGMWSLPAQADPPFANPPSYQESDFIYTGGKYYLFSTSSQDPAWIDVYVGDTPADLVHRPATFRHVAPIRYPTVVKDGNTWHLWGVNPKHKWTEHWVSTNSDPTGFVYADTPFPLSSKNSSPVVDFAVRKHPTNGYWYGVGFESGYNAPLLLTRASSPNGPWAKLNYETRGGEKNGVFGDTGAPPWASAARPDPNLAFTRNGRAWVLFTGNAQALPSRNSPTYRSGIVELDVDTGKAIGNAVVLFDHRSHEDLPFTSASDLNLVSVTGQPDRIFAETDSPNYPLAVLELPQSVRPTDGRTSADLVRLDMAKGFSVAAGITPGLLRTPYRWAADGLTVEGNYGGATSYLAAANLSDLTFTVDFTPKSINTDAVNTVAHIGGPNYTKGSGISVQLDATGNDKPSIKATVAGNNGSKVILDSHVAAEPNTRYSVVVRRVDSTLTLEVNGVTTARATYAAPLTGLEAWSLAAEATRTQEARNPFQGTIHSFVVVGEGS
ncbi:MAG: hypothetical protein ACJ78Q_00250 [Chloroflexia bacterium]